MSTLVDPERQIQLEQQGNVFIMTLTGTPHKANVFSAPLLRRLDRLLDTVEANLPCCLIIKGRGKFFSAGFDLQALTGTSHKSNKANDGKQPSSSKAATAKHQGNDLVEQSWKLLARLLTFSAPTIALMNGHAFGLGLFLGLACDHRIMIQWEDENGEMNETFNQARLCLPEITIGLPLGSGFAALAKTKLYPSTLRTAALTGKQFDCQEALHAGIIDKIARQSIDDGDTKIPNEVFAIAEGLVATSIKEGILTSIKMELHGDAYTALMAGQNRARL
jgi:enoyl-CoA hydratase/carnithine racemase